MVLNERILNEIKECERLLIGIGEEWNGLKADGEDSLYEKLGKLIKDKDYFIVTTLINGELMKSSLDTKRMVAPCGNVTWRQCSKSCTKDIWEPGEIADDICPHCKEPLTGNTIKAENYIEEGYLPQWNAYTRWLAGTLNKKLLILELGVGFQTPTVIRWPFEKTASVNNKAFLYRIHGSFAQLTEGLREKAESIPVNSVDFIRSI
ncbi:hypothetical protein LAD12857_18830 [Lacrimispora amygdalina]|uniref:NAD-dependent protein deacetylase, SIR2 family n=1 Tax=Lacrimispora amygdalina TaxID=253257 RepID=A0ABQ5M614_9FIRM